jgi:pyroglutamyl-peptidase
MKTSLRSWLLGDETSKEQPARLLLTGFEPHGGSRFNSSEQTVLAFAHDAVPGLDVRVAILPLHRTDGPAKAIAAIREYRPDAIVCLGDSARRTALSVKRVALNLMDYPVRDNAGNQFIDLPVVPGGPDAYFTTLPVRAVTEAIRAVRVPAELSLSPGAFLSNHVMYEILHFLALEDRQTPAGLIHLPALPEQALGGSAHAPSMALATMVRGVRAALNAVGVNHRERQKVMA